MTFKRKDFSTPSESELGNAYQRFDQFTPAIYFGHRDGFSDDVYDKFDSFSLKHFKTTVASLKNEPILRLDTFDLYYGAEHTKGDLSKIRKQTFSNNKGNGSFGAPYLGTPLKFQRIHFRGHKENGDVSEYYAIFLVSDPVEVTKKQVAGYGQYVNNQCEEITSENFENSCRTDAQEQTTSKASVTSWNNLSYIKGDGNTKPTAQMYKDRLIIGDALFSQVKSLNPYSPSSNPCHKTLSSCSVDSFPYEILVRDKDDKTVVAFPVKELVNLVLSEFSQKISSQIVYDIVGQTAKTKSIECTPTSNGFNITTSDGQVNIPCNCDCCDSEGQAQSILLSVTGNIFNIPTGNNSIDSEISSILFGK